MVDLNRYSSNRIPFQDWYRENSHYGISMAISIWACGTHTPCLACAFYLAEDIGFTEEIVRLINIFIKEYDYTLIKNQPANSPFLEKYS